MDALVNAALKKVEETVASLSHSTVPSHHAKLIVKAINAVDALKSALKAL